MKRSLHLILIIALVKRSIAFYLAPVVTASFVTRVGRDAVFDTVAWRRIGRDTATDGKDMNCRERPPRRTSLRLSTTGSIAAPPPTSQVTRSGGGDDGIRVLTREEYEAAVTSFAGWARKRLDVEEEYREFMTLLQGSGGLNRDVKICLRLIVVNPLYNMKAVGFQTVHDLEMFGRENALLLDLSPLLEVPSLRVFSLESTKTLDEDPEQVLKDPLIRQYYSRVRRSCYVLDDIPDWADIGPYWYQGALPRDVCFFFRKRFTAVNEYEITLQRPGPGVSTGSGTVGGARVITIDEAETLQDMPGHVKVREIAKRLSSRLLEEMQGENPITNDLQ